MKNTKLDDGAFSSLGVTWADISVSGGLKERALLLVDRFAHELEVLGAKFENSHPPLPPLRRGARRESGGKREKRSMVSSHFADIPMPKQPQNNPKKKWLHHFRPVGVFFRSR